MKRIFWICTVRRCVWKKIFIQWYASCSRSQDSRWVCSLPCRQMKMTIATRIETFMNFIWIELLHPNRIQISQKIPLRNKARAAQHAYIQLLSDRQEKMDVWKGASARKSDSVAKTSAAAGQRCIKSEFKESWIRRRLVAVCVSSDVWVSQRDETLKTDAAAAAAAHVEIYVHDADCCKD